VVLAGVIFDCSILNILRRKFPGMSTMASYAVVQAVYYSIFGLATFWNRHQVYTYVSAPRALTAWYGRDTPAAAI
jgi:cation transport ATPase